MLSLTIGVVSYYLLKYVSIWPDKPSIERRGLRVWYTLTDFKVCVHGCAALCQGGQRSVGSRMCAVAGASPTLDHCSTILGALWLVHSTAVFEDQSYGIFAVKRRYETG